MMNGCIPENTWRVDKRLNVGTLMGLISSMVVVISLVVGLKTRLAVAEDKLCAVETRIEALRETAVKVERIDERVLGIRALLLEIKDELKVERSR